MVVQSWLQIGATLLISFVLSIRGRTLGIFGEPRVNVLELNLDLQNH